MLDKIINVDTSTPYTDKKNPAFAYEKFIRQSQVAEFFPKDSIAFSPAAVYLSKLNWFAKEVRFTNDNRVFLVLVISDFEFRTILDLKNVYKDLRQVYFISKKFPDNYKDTIITAQISLKKEKINLNEIIENYRLTGIRNLFSRIGGFSNGTKLTIDESYTLNGLLDGIKEEIWNELEKIQNAVYTFIQKFDKFKFNENHVFEYDGYEPIILERISKEYAR
jgi:hypothetical protein